MQQTFETVPIGDIFFDTLNGSQATFYKFRKESDTLATCLACDHPDYGVGALVGFAWNHEVVYFRPDPAPTGLCPEIRTLTFDELRRELIYHAESVKTLLERGKRKKVFKTLDWMKDAANAMMLRLDAANAMILKSDAKPIAKKAARAAKKAARHEASDNKIKPGSREAGSRVEPGL